MKLEDFIKRARKVHGDKYDYSKVEYVNNKTKVCIICPVHGEFWIRPDNHLIGKGCKKCSVEAHRKYSLNTFKWLDRQHLDFYLPDYNIAIECQGEQHFKPVDFSGNGVEWANENHKKVVRLDNLKKSKCKENNIKLLYYSDKKYRKNVITDLNILLEIIYN